MARAKRTGSRYEVAVTGGKGVVVGDFATVYQLFKDAPVPLASQIRAQEFRAIIDERTRNFVGRQFLVRQIDEALADPEFPCGFVLVRGQPGIGKTALMGHLVKERGYVHHFNVAPLGIRSPRAFLANVCAQLIVRYGLEHTALTADATQDGGFLSRLLSEVAATPANLPAVIVLDALDEASDDGLAPGANRLCLPPALPTGVYFVVSTREEADYGLFVSSRRDILLADDDAHNLDDVRSYIREFIERDAERMRARIEAWGVTADEFVDTVTARSGGNFMYLVHVLRDIAAGRLDAGSMDSIRNLPQGLKDYYRRHWNEMRSADPEHFRRYQQPVVCLLATAREPVSLAQLLDWTRQVWEQQSWGAAALDPLAVKDVLAAWREFLTESTVSGDPQFRVYHASFQDFLAEEVGLLDYHQAIGQAALARIPGFGTGG